MKGHKTLLIIPIIIVVVIIIIKFFSFCFFGPVTFLDYPHKLSNKIDTIEVTYMRWACACANWLPVENSSGLLNNGNDEPDYIFLESDDNSNKIPEENKNLDYNGIRIKLIGKYYKDKGISRDYSSPTGQKPEKAKVFKYSECQILNRLSR